MYRISYFSQVLSSQASMLGAVINTPAPSSFTVRGGYAQEGHRGMGCQTSFQIEIYHFAAGAPKFAETVPWLPRVTPEA